MGESACFSDQRIWFQVFPSHARLIICKALRNVGTLFTKRSDELSSLSQLGMDHTRALKLLLANCKGLTRVPN